MASTKAAGGCESAGAALLPLQGNLATARCGELSVRPEPAAEAHPGSRDENADDHVQGRIVEGDELSCTLADGHLTPAPVATLPHLDDEIS